MSTNADKRARVSTRARTGAGEGRRTPSRRAFLLELASAGVLVALRVAADLCGLGRPRGSPVWQIDPEKCIQCGQCATHCGMMGRPEAFWCCPDAPSGTSGCPSPRPRLGSACTSEGTLCDYGGCSGNVTLQCTGGTWQPTTIGCPG